MHERQTSGFSFVGYLFGNVALQTGASPDFARFLEKRGVRSSVFL